MSFRCEARNGLRRFQIADPSNDPERIRRDRGAGAAGGDRGGRRRADLLDQPGPHPRLLRSAVRGARRLRGHRPLLSQGPGRAADARRGPGAGAAFRRCGRRSGGPVAELHSHCTIGLAPLVYVEGVRAGFQVVHTGCGPLVARDLAARGREHRRETWRPPGFASALDLEAAGEVAAYFAELACAKGLPAGRPQEFDGEYYRHQLPGGMVTTTQRMLAEIRRPELFHEVLEEVTRVRAEMGYPIIVTPVSQFIASQAAHNVIDGERWKTVSDETIRYFLGHYGEPPAPVDPSVADTVLLAPAGREALALEPISLEGARERFGTGISEEELLLRLTMPAEQVDAMIAARAGQGGLLGPAAGGAGDPASTGRRRPASRLGEPGTARRRAGAGRGAAPGPLGAPAGQGIRPHQGTTRRWCGGVADPAVPDRPAGGDRARVHVRRRRDARAPRRRRPGAAAARRARGARADPRLGAQAGAVHQRQPRSVRTRRGGAAARRLPGLRRGAADPDRQRHLVSAARVPGGAGAAVRQRGRDRVDDRARREGDHR